MSDTYSAEETAPGDAAEPGETSEPGEAKSSQQAVNYRAGTPIKNCGLCGHFTGSVGDDANGCEVVDGDISAFGFCDIYLRQPNPFKAQGGGAQAVNTASQRLMPMPPPAAALGPPPAGPPPGLRIGNKTYGG